MTSMRKADGSSNSVSPAGLALQIGNAAEQFMHVKRRQISELRTRARHARENSVAAMVMTAIHTRTAPSLYGNDFKGEAISHIVQFDGLHGERCSQPRPRVGSRPL